MALYQDLTAAIITAQKSGDTAALGVLRLLKNSVDAQVKTGAEMSDETVQKVAGQEAKRRTEAAELYRRGGAEEKAIIEETEAQLLQPYLPEMMGETELLAVVEKVIAEVGATTAADLGKVMGAVRPRVGNKADMGEVNRLVRQKLAA